MRSTVQDSGSRKAAALGRYGYKAWTGRSAERRKYCKNIDVGERLANP